MSKNKWWVSVLVGILILVVLVGVGYAIYRLGYAEGARAAAGGQLTPRQFQGLPNMHNLAPGLHGMVPGILPFARAGRLMGLTWFRAAGRMVITALVVITLVLLIILLFGKLGSKRTLQKAPVKARTDSGEQEQHEE